MSGTETRTGHPDELPISAAKRPKTECDLGKGVDAALDSLRSFGSDWRTPKAIEDRIYLNFPEAFRVRLLMGTSYGVQAYDGQYACEEYAMRMHALFSRAASIDRDAPRNLFDVLVDPEWAELERDIADAKTSESVARHPTFYALLERYKYLTAKGVMEDVQWRPLETTVDNDELYSSFETEWTGTMPSEKAIKDTWYIADSWLH